MQTNRRTALPSRRGNQDRLGSGRDSLFLGPQPGCARGAQCRCNMWPQGSQYMARAAWAQSV
eukprot:4013839-Pyramimonas_sp.AAC.1